MFSIKVEGAAAIIKRIERARSKLSDLRSANKKALVVVDRWVQENFRNEGGKVGGWASLADATIHSRMRRRNKKGTIRILQDNGQLRMRWEHIVDDKQAILRSAVDYGIYHQTGTDKMPQRRILPEMKEIGPDLRKVYEDHIKRALE